MYRKVLDPEKSQRVINLAELNITNNGLVNLSELKNIIGYLFIAYSRADTYSRDSKSPDHQFGFRKKHATIEQVHRVVDIINTALEDKKYCTAVFLDISQGLMTFYIKPKNYYPLAFQFS